MIPTDLLVCPRWMVPGVPEGIALEEYALAVSSGRIVAILPRAQAIHEYRPAQRIDLPHHALIPGLINTHTHAAMTLLRGLADDLPLMVWLQEHIWPAESRWVDPEFVRDGNRLAMAEMIRSGTTCFNDMYFFPEITVQEVLNAGLRASIGLIAVEFPSAWANDVNQYIDKGLSLHRETLDEPLLRCAFAPHAPYTVGDEALSRIAGLCERLDLRVHMHVHETAHEVQEAASLNGSRPLTRLKRLGFLNERFMAVHMTQLTAAEIQDLAENRVHVLHCPESNMKLASGMAPVAHLAAAGVNVALGTDGAASNNDLDMLGEMRTGALLGKIVAGDASALPAPTLLRMATLNGAKALGLDRETGSLEIGKSADMVALHLTTIETQPLYNPISQIVYATNREQVSDVWVAGRRLLENRRLTTLDKADILDRAQVWQRRLRED